METSSISGIEASTYRATLGHYASGIVVVSTIDDEGPVGFTCQSFSSASVSPPLVTFNVMADSQSYPRIRKTGKFSVNVLANHQQELSNQFARKGPDKWQGVEWSTTKNDNPVIDDSLMWVDCVLTAEHEVGDHTLVIGEVVAVSPAEWHTREPLLYFRGAYGQLHHQDPAETS